MVARVEPKQFSCCVKSTWYPSFLLERKRKLTLFERFVVMLLPSCRRFFFLVVVVVVVGKRTTDEETDCRYFLVRHL